MTDYHNIEMQSASTLEMTTAHGASFDQPGGLGMAEEDELFSQDAAISSTALAKPFRLREFTVMCMIFNRMIGKLLVSLPVGKKAAILNVLHRVELRNIQCRLFLI